MSAQDRPNQGGEGMEREQTRERRKAGIQWSAGEKLEHLEDQHIYSVQLNKDVGLLHIDK